MVKGTPLHIAEIIKNNIFLISTLSVMCTHCVYQVANENMKKLYHFLIIFVSMFSGS